MSLRLNQVLGVETGVKADHSAMLNKLSQVVDKPALFEGFTRTYAKRREDGEDQPRENAKVQFQVKEIVDDMAKSFTRILDITAQKDFGNCDARADVVVEGVTIVKNAPVPYLLFLKKTIDEVRSYFLAKLPTLDTAVDWTIDVNSGLFRSEPVLTTRTKKVQKAIVLYDATDKHPAQTQLITEDEPVGTWTQVRHSGAAPLPEKKKLLEKLDKLTTAVVVAIGEANSALTPKVDVGAAVFGFLLK